MPNAALHDDEIDDDEGALVPLGLQLEADAEARRRVLDKYVAKAEAEVRSPAFITATERVVVGSVLVDPSILDDMPVRLIADDFFTGSLRLIWAAALALHERRAAISSLTVCNELLRRARLDDVGGINAVTAIEHDATTSAMVPAYARQVRDAARMRSIQHVCSRASVRAKVHDGGDPAKLAHETIAALERVGDDDDDADGAAHLPTVVSRALASIPAYGGKFQGVASGYRALDEHLGGGFTDGEFTIVGARPSMGKTALSLGFVRNIAIRRGEPIAFFSLEMSNEQLVKRLIADVSGVDVRLPFDKLTETQRRAIGQAADRIERSPLVFDDTPAMSELPTLLARARRYKRRHGVRAIFIDYLQLAHDVTDEKRHEQVSAVSKGLKLLAKELRIPVIALSQLSRAVEGRENKRPMLSDLRESGSLEQDADVIAFLFRRAYYAKDKAIEADKAIAELLIEKNRNGPTGTVTLGWHAVLTRFDDAPHD